MAVTLNTGTVVPATGVETQVAAIAGGPFDNLSVYFQGGVGGGGGPLGLFLYASVNGVVTRVAQAQVMGTPNASIIEWSLPGGPLAGPSETTNVVSAAGTAYSVTVQDLSQGVPPPGAPARGAVTVTLAGVNEFDNAADAELSFTGALAGGVTETLGPIAGWAQSLDVALSQQNLPLVEVEVVADCGAGSVQATVTSVQMSGADTTIAQVFRKLALPVFTRLFVSVTNLSQTNIPNLSLTAATTSINTAAGGAVTLAGNANGPSNANTVEDFTIESVNTNVPAGSFVGPQGETSGTWYVGVSGLTGNVNVTVPDMLPGSKVTVKCEDGSLGAGAQITVSSSTGKTIDGAADYVITLAQNGAFGAITIEMNDNTPTEWQLV